MASKAPLLILLRNKFKKDPPTKNDICKLFDLQEYGNSFLNKFGNGKTLSLLDANLLFFAFGLTDSEIRSCGYQIRSRNSGMLITKFSDLGSPIEVFERIGIGQGAITKKDVEDYKKKYTKIVIPYLKQVKHRLLVNDFLGKGFIEKHGVRMKPYYEAHQEVFSMIESKLGHMGKKRNFVKLPSLDKYIRVLQIPQVLHWENNKDKFKMEALILLPQVTFEHIARCIISEYDNANVFVSPLRRPYHYAILDNYTLTEYFRAYDRSLFPDLLFIENGQFDVILSELYQLYDAEFKSIIEDNSLRLTARDLLDLMNIKKYRNHLRNKYDEWRITRAARIHLIQLLEAKCRFLEKILIKN